MSKKDKAKKADMVPNSTYHGELECLNHQAEFNILHKDCPVRHVSDGLELDDVKISEKRSEKRVRRSHDKKFLQHSGSAYTATRVRPLARRRLSINRPALVLILLRKPCLRCRFRLLG